MQSTEIFLEHSGLGRPLAWSLGLHVGFTICVILLGLILHGRTGAGWGAGGGGEAIGVSLVSNIPLPASQVQTQNVLANDSKGLTQSKPQEKEIEPDAIPIAGKNAKNKPKPTSTASHQKAPPQPEEETNEVPFGKGGPVSAAGAKGGFGFQGGAGDDFGTAYAWYVRVVQQKISENWLRYEVDPRIQQANRVYVVFDINRSGRPGSARVEQSSGVPSLDQSALRAVERIDTFGPLPSDYSGSKVTVEFWFDYDRSKR
jgi:periplasmic protein TonB